MSLNFFFPEKSPAADVDNAESPRGQPAKSGTTWQPRRSILISSHRREREREDKLGFEGEKREGKESSRLPGKREGKESSRPPLKSHLFMSAKMISALFLHYSLFRVQIRDKHLPLIP